MEGNKVEIMVDGGKLLVKIKGILVMVNTERMQPPVTQTALEHDGIVIAIKPL